MTTHMLERAEIFIWNNARLLERRLFSFLFRGSSSKDVLAALSAYQNNDDGFGNALEPDKRTPSSQPVDQEIALRVLDDIGFDETIVGKICDFLKTITTEERGVPFVLPTVRDAPRADWWNTEDHPSASINPTASIAGLLHKYNFKHPWLDGATDYCWRRVEELQEESDHNLLCAALFLEHVPDRDRAEKAFQPVGEQILKRTALDPDTPGYNFKPLTWAPTPESLCRSLFTDSQIDTHLQALAAQQQEDGGWAITWPAISPASEMEARGIVTVSVLKTFKAYGYL